MKIKYKPFWVKNGDHNNISIKYTKRLFDAVKKFLEYVEDYK